MDTVLIRRGAWTPRQNRPGGISGQFHLRSAGWLVKRSRTFHGRLVPEGDEIAVFIKNPPRRGRYAHEHCLQYIANGWFRLHFERAPRDFDSAVAFTEYFLQCCLDGYDDAG